MTTAKELNGQFMTDEEVAAKEALLADGVKTPEGELFRNKPRKYRNTYFRIHIPKSPEPGKKSKPVFVAPQGVAFLLHRGVDLVVPGMVVEALQNAVERRHEYDDESGDIVAMDVMAYPVMVLGPATAEEYRKQKIQYGRQNAPGVS